MPINSREALQTSEINDEHSRDGNLLIRSDGVIEGLYLHADLQYPETLWGRANHEDPAYQGKHDSQKMLKHPSKQNKIEEKKKPKPFFSFVCPAECLSFIVRNDVTLKNCPLKSEMLSAHGAVLRVK